MNKQLQNLDIDKLNKELRNKAPEEIVQWALSLTDNKIVTTSFGVYSAVLLSTFHNLDPNIKVIWCDTGYNTPNTYRHATDIINRFDLNVKMYVPLQSSAFTDVTIGIPEVNDPKHAVFTETVKLEPFRRALAEHQPDVWFTNIRVRQTEYRNKKDILSFSKDGILKVSPFYYYTDFELDNYLEVLKLPRNDSYFDPTKALQNRECGIHLQ